MTDKTKEVLFPEENDDISALGGGFGFMRWMAAAGETLPPWWSQERDRQLRIFTKNSDHLSGAVNMMQEMIGSISVVVEPRDLQIKAHRKLAQEYTNIFNNKSSSRSNRVTTGWQAMLNPFLNDICSQDNGGWLAIEGESDQNGRLIGMPTKLIHLDSYNCWRTRSREYPVIYTDHYGKRFKLHRSRIINITSSPDASNEMCGVGFCSVSRAMNTIQRLVDISRYYQEKLGSRPPRGFLFVTGTGAERGAKAIENSVFISNERMDNEGLTRFSRVPVIGLRDGTVQLISFSELPDGFDEMQTTQLAVWVLSLAFGVDSRQLGFALGVTGQTKADAEIQHLKMRGKFPGWFITEFTRQLDYKFLPPFLKATFDQQDDAQDAAVANMRKVRSDYRKTYIETGLWTTRVTHEDMLKAGDITEEQFLQLELAEGRLEGGLSVMSLFDNPDFADLLIADDLSERLKELYTILNEATSRNEEKRIRLAIAALEFATSRNAQAETEIQDKLSLNGSQIRALKETLEDLRAGNVSQSNATQILTSLGIPQSNAEQMINDAIGGTEPEEVIEEEVIEDDTKQSNLDEVYAKYHSLVNMSASELKDWSKTDCSKKASLDRKPIQRNLNLLRKNKSEWTGSDIKSANRTISFISRMKANLGGKNEIADCGTKAHISLKNWAFDSKKKDDTKAIGSYRASINAAIRGLFNNQIDLVDFVGAMNSAIDRGFEQAWTQGALECGIQRSERTTEEINQLNRMKAENKTFVFGFAEWIETLRDEGGLISSALGRGQMWINRYNEVQQKASAMACANQKAEWVVGETEHCRTCNGLNGRVYRYSVWNDNVLPQSKQLECGGYRCKCRLKPTDKPITRGRFPRSLLA